jgi:hypothetical protein
LNIKKEEGTFTFVKPIHMAPFIDWSWQIHEFCLPTEFSIIRPQFLVPNKGRLYGTFLSYEDGKFYDARSIPQTDHALSHLHSPNVSAVECFKDYGDDGHTDMRLSGFFLLLGGRHDRLYKKIPAKK